MGLVAWHVVVCQVAHTLLGPQGSRGTLPALAGFRQDWQCTAGG